MIDCKRFLRNFGKKILFELKNIIAVSLFMLLTKSSSEYILQIFFNRNPRTGENIYAADYNKRIPP